MVQVDSGKVRLVDKDDSMMEHWNICFIIFLYHGLKLLRHGHINSISILNILEKDFHCIPVSLGACLSTNSRRLLSSADPPPTFPTCEQPSMSCGGSRKQSLQRERERDLSPGSESYQLSIASQGHLGNCQPKMIKLKYGLIEFWIAAHREPGLDSLTCAVF